MAAPARPPPTLAPRGGRLNLASRRSTPFHALRALPPPVADFADFLRSVQDEIIKV